MEYSNTTGASLPHSQSRPQPPPPLPQPAAGPSSLPSLPSQSMQQQQQQYEYNNYPQQLHSTSISTSTLPPLPLPTPTALPTATLPTAATIPTLPVPRIPLAERDLYMLSLPSQDLPSYYDSSDSSTSESESGPLNALTSNRGNKLHSSARNARQGRLGSYPHTDLGFPSTSSSKRRKTLDGQLALSSRHGFAIAPNFHLVPRRSPSPPAPAVLPPPPQSPLDLLLSTSLQKTFGPKNATLKTLAMSATGLIEQEGALIGSLRRVCAGLRGEGFEFRWEGDDEARREREIEDAKERRAYQLEEERYLKSENLRREEEERIALEARARARVKQEEADALRAKKGKEDEEQAEEEEKRKRMQQEAEDIAATAAAVEQERVIVQEEEPAKGENGLIPTEAAEVEPVPALVVEASSSSSHIILPSALPALPLDIAVPIVDTIGTEDGDISMQDDIQMNGGDSTMNDTNAIASTSTAIPEPVVVEDVIDPEQANGASEIIAVEESQNAVVAPTEEGDVAVAVEGDVGDAEAAEADAEAMALEGEDGEEEPLLRRRSGRVAQRATDPTRARSGSTSTESDRDEPTATPQLFGTRFALGARDGGVLDEEMPEYAKRMVDPEVFVRSLFVTEGVVGVPVSIQGGPFTSTDVDLLSPNEQEVMVHDCLTDLHRFMADSLEYRSRLSEIRDGVLGVERRRKGMWKLVRSVAVDWLEEEAAAYEE